MQTLDEIILLILLLLLLFTATVTHAYTMKICLIEICSYALFIYLYFLKTSI